MDYEKAYKAVLKTATQWIKDGCTDKERICLESVFPELRESEDERMIKAIEHILYENYSDAAVIEGVEIAEIVTWLEKQKEPIDPFDTKLFQDGVKEGRRLEREEMKKEQKPVEPSDEELQRHQDELYDFKVFAARQAREHHISFVHDFEWNNFCAELLSYFNEKQKPAKWSKEDKNRLEEAIEVVEANGCWVRSDDAVKQVSDFLKSLPERFNLQPKQEWSEEDKKKITFLERLIRYNVPEGQYGWVDGHRGGFVTKLEAIAMLKSLRPLKDCSSCAKNLEGYISGRSDAENKLLEQFGALVTPEDELHIKPRWKPSAEQMEAFSQIVRQFKPDKELESLYDNLKKL